MIYRGVRIVELASGIAAPYATMFLADHGADVVKVEPPGGDPYRSEPGFQTFNRNKRSVVLDDPTPLLAGADVVVTDRPGTAAELRRAARGAVIVSMPPWGERGPLVDAPSTPDLLAAATGIMWNQQTYGEVPVHIVVPFVPYATAALGALAIASGLYARANHGWAPAYEVSEVAGAAALQLEQFRVGDELEERAGSAPMGAKGRVPIYRLFRAGDDRWFFLACGTVRFYERLLEVIGRPELRHHPLLPDPPWGLMALDAIAFIAPILEEVFEAEPRDVWLRRFREADIPAQPVQSRAEFLASPLCAANGLDVTVDHPELGRVEMMGVPLVMEAAPGRVERHAPLLGEHTDVVLAEEPRPTTTGAPHPEAEAGSTEDRAPLAGVKVIDLSSFIAGPVVSRHLAMLGADVVKIESPAGDPFRAFGPPFANWNQGKRSIVVDLTTDAGRELLERLVDRADVVIENFRPGVAERLGADHGRLRARNPNLVFLSSPGYGDDETMADAPAFDPLMQALGGLMYAQGGLGADGSGVSGPADGGGGGGEPVFLTVAIHDVVTPIIGAFGVVSGLYHRARTGEAQRVRTSLAQATVVVQAAELTRFAGAPPTLGGGFDFRGPSEDRCCVEGEDGWWFQDGPLRAPIVRYGLVNEAIAAENDLLVTHDHPAFGELTSFGQLVVGAGPPLGRAPLLDEHHDEIIAELGVTVEAAPRAATATPQTLFRGWTVVAAAFSVLFVAYGLQFSFGVFVKAIEDDVGWSRTQLSTPYALYVFLYSALSSVSGSFTDRRGPRTVILVGGLFLAAGYIGFGLSQSLWQVYLTLGVVAAIGMSAAWVPCNATVVRWFTRRRGMAVGIASTGGSVGNFAVPPLAAGLIELFGWRTTLVVMGAVGALLLAISSRFMVRSPEEVGLHPDGDPEPAPATVVGHAPGAPATDAPSDPALAARTDFTASEARKTSTFWVLLCAFGLTWLVVFVPYVHLAPFAEDLGLSKFASAMVVSSIGLGGIVGRLSVGWASDRVGRRLGLSCMLALQVLAFAGFAASHGAALLYPSAVVFGASYGGATTLFPAITSDFFGRTYTGSIVGLIFAIAGSSAAVGPFVAGTLYDNTGSYRVAFLVSAACNLAAIGLVAMLRAPRPRGTAVVGLATAVTT